MKKAHIGMIILLAVLLLTPQTALPLGVGDTAPKLDVKILSGPDVQPASGKVTIVEFWATWCPSCRQAIPHLNKLHAKYGDTVQIIGISNESEDKVRQFMKSVKMDYTVAVDQGKGTFDTYMAGIDGIPQAFVIDKKGAVQWGGHPMAMESIVDKVLNGSYNLARQAKIDAIINQLKNLTRDSSPDDIQALLTRLVVLDPSPEYLGYLDGFLAQTGKTGTGIRRDALRKAITENADDPVALNGIARELAGAKELFDRDLQAALDTARKVVKLAPKPEYLDTLARVLYACGKIDTAINTQKKAVDAAKKNGETEDDIKRLQHALEYYQKIKNIK